MTRRERLEARAEKRRDWAAARERKAAASFGRALRIADNIPLGQPILVGHHSERHARADQRRIESGMRAGCESADMAKHHEAKAEGLEDQLERSIFSDDPDALEQLEAKATAIDARCELMRQANAAHKRAKGLPGWAATLGLLPEDAAHMEAEALRLFQVSPYERKPFPAYSLSNARANARRTRERAKDIRRRQEVSAEAEAAPGGIKVARHMLSDGTVWLVITFAEKPSRAILLALRAAGFRWGAPSWHGPAHKLPATCPTANGTDLEVWDAIQQGAQP